MGRILNSGLVLVLTLITVIALFTFKSNKIPIELNEIAIEVYQDDKPDGTGLIFDDYGKDINLKLERDNQVEVNTKDDKPKKFNYKDDTKRYAKEYRDFKFLLEERIISRTQYTPGKIIVVCPEPKTLSKQNVQTVAANSFFQYEKKLSYEEKVSILKIAKNLNVKDINAIRRAINSGVSNEETKAIWNMLKEKLDEKEYNKLINIVDKIQ